MDDFSANGTVNWGMPPSQANAISPGKRPLSSMTPTMVFEDGRLIVLTGAAGGTRIVTTTIQVLLDILVFGMNPAQAVAQPRIHHQLIPDVLQVESWYDMKLVDQLMKTGFPELKISNTWSVDSVENTIVIVRDRNSLNGTIVEIQAASDPRVPGKAYAV
jgi:gamma-glutamyltranspeptidase